jgi:hypothetical protein
VAKRHGTQNLILLFADTQIEDEDLYRFLEESAQDVGGKLIRLKEGRDPWEVFFDERFLGNTRIDPCSKILKRQFLRRWVEDNLDPDEAVLYLGIDWTEEHRIDKAAKYWGEWDVRAPMCEPPLKDKHDMLDMLEDAGIEPPRLYKLGFPHNNCGGFCIKAGEAHFRLLYETMPDRYAYHEEKEQEFREFIEKDVAVLRDRDTGDPMTLREFRLRLEEDREQVDEHAWGGCGCFSEPSPLELPVTSLGLAAHKVEYMNEAGLHTLEDVELALLNGDDLTEIKWIGPKTVEDIEKQLSFLLG